jgi:predicted nucleotidyltransferase
MITDFEALIRLLSQDSVEFILVGGIAAAAHGAARSTRDLDVVYRRSPENIARLVKALSCHAPYLRGAPPGLPFRFDRETVLRGLNFTLITDLGELDLLGEIVGGGNYEELLPYTVEVEIFGWTCRTIGLKRLIEVKRAAGRPKDLEAIAELEALLEERLKGRT